MVDNSEQYRHDAEFLLCWVYKDQTFPAEDGDCEEKSSSGNEQEEPETESCGTLENQVLTLCRVVRENIVDFMKHPHGSRVLRTLMHVLAGCSAKEQPDARPGGKTESCTYTYNTRVKLWYKIKKS